MIDFISHIEYLLLRHDCVAVAGLGAFLVHETPAHYDAAAGIFIPPTRTLGFNSAVNINDGLLAGSVARKEGISIEAAASAIAVEVAAFRHQLSTSGYLPMGRLGVMSVGSEPDALLFEPAADSNVTLRYTGLLPLDISPIADDDTEIAAESADGASARSTILPLPIKIAASVILLLVACGLFFTTGDLVNNTRQDLALLDSGLTGRLEASQVISEAELTPVSREIILNIAPPAELPTIVDTTSVAPQRKGAAVTPSATPGRYLLVVASLPSRRAAEKHIGDDSSLHIIEMEGKFRVYTSSCATLSEATEMASDVRKTHPNVWICKR